MCSEVQKVNLLPREIECNRGLFNAFNGEKATPEQAIDMLTFRQIGTQAFHQYVTYYILKQSSNAPVRRRKLLTMAEIKQTKRKSKQKEKEAKQVIKCLRKRLTWYNQTKLPYDPSNEQYSVLPRALADEDGNPHKGSKRIWSEKLESRYQSIHLPVFIKTVPWLPQVDIVDAMFLVNTRPLRRTKTIEEYAILLFNRFILEHYKAGVREVHLIFDKPSKQAFNPKQFEHAKRYLSKKTSCKTLSAEHVSSQCLRLLDYLILSREACF